LFRAAVPDAPTAGVFASEAMAPKLEGIQADAAKES
jgi:hypothetical protein